VLGNSGQRPVASARTAVKEQSPLRGAPLVPRSASLTAASLRLLSLYGGAGAPPLSTERRVDDCYGERKLLET